MKQYTVIGYYADNDERAAFPVKASNPDEAEHKAAKLGALRGGDFRTCGVVAGNVKLLDTKHYTTGGI